MSAREITQALAGEWRGHYGMCPGPDHSPRDRSLKVWDSDSGVMVHSFAGEDWRTCRDWLKRHGLLPDDREDAPQRTPKRPAKMKPAAHPDEARHTECALAIWRAAAPADEHSFAAAYLQARAITIPVPPSIRSHSALKHSQTGQMYPAMVCAVQSPDQRVVAVHRTFLTADGTRQAGVVTKKMALGPLGSGAVRLAAAGDTLGLAEGVETGLSAIQLFDVPVWAALGSRLHQVAIPETVKHIIVFADNGEAGHTNAEKASDAFTRQGRRVTLRYPPDALGDWNDYLQARMA